MSRIVIAGSAEIIVSMCDRSWGVTPSCRYLTRRNAPMRNAEHVCKRSAAAAGATGCRSGRFKFDGPHDRYAADMIAGHPRTLGGRALRAAASGVECRQMIAELLPVVLALVDDGAIGIAATRSATK
jgi:hypothetical protein